MAGCRSAGLPPHRLRNLLETTNPTGRPMRGWVVRGVERSVDQPAKRAEQRERGISPAVSPFGQGAHQSGMF